MSVPVLSIQKMSHYFGGLKAVSDFTFDVPEGVIYGLIGPNGSGKTTTFNLVTGIYTPTEGKILFQGEEIKGQKPFRIVHRGIARTFQNIRLFAYMSVLDNVLTGTHNLYKSFVWGAITRNGRYRREEREGRELAMDLLTKVGLAGKRDEYARNLPYGEQRKLEIVRALASGPSLLLLDEPAAGMNPDETEQLMRIIAEVRKMFNLSVLVIEHHMDLIMGICDHIHVLNFGCTLADGTADEIANDPKVVEAYLGAEEEK